MKLFSHIGFAAGFVVTALLCLGAAERTLAQFTLTGTVDELVARGVNAGFETPVVAAGETEAFSTLNIGPGWNFNLISGVSNNHGVQNPATGFYGQVNPLPAPFEGNQIGFINLNNWFSQGEIVSDPIGRLRSGQSYTLNVAVGARNTTGQNDIAYRVGLRASDGTDLGSFATATLRPGASPANIQELTYTLNSSSVPSYVGDAVRIVIGGYNTGVRADAPMDGLAQANFDNVRLAGVFDEIPVQSAAVTINRQTGGITLSNTGNVSLNVLGYSLTSNTFGSFNQAAWNRIGGSFTQLSAPGSATDLSEMDFQGSGITFSTATPINLGNAWYRTPFQDVQGELLLGNGSTLPLSVQYSGNPIAVGDLNGDGLINAADWNLFKAGQGTNFTGLSPAQAYSKGDLNGDLRHDLFDFVAFRNAFEAANGAGSFAAMLAGTNVPEPGAGLLLLTGGLLALAHIRRRRRRRTGGDWLIFAESAEQKCACPPRRTSPRAALLAAAFLACVLSTGPAAAQSVIAHWSFDAPTLSIDGGNIIQVGEATGNHVATPGLGGTGGATGNAFVSQPFNAATSSVSGRFGEALQFAGDNFLLFDNLTELMAANGAPSYSISMWVNTTSTPVGGTPFMTLSNWGNEPVDAGPTRFTYAFGPAASGTDGNFGMRGQTRWANPASGGGGTAGTDIFASTNTTPGPVTDGNWHMLTWTFNTTTGALRRYYDGEFVSQLTSTASSFALADSSSAVGGMGVKADDGQMLPAGFKLDEVWVFNGILTDEQVENLYNINNIVPFALSLRVNPANGQVQLRNDSGQDIAFSAYRISSVNGSLNPGGWNPISNQSIPGFPAGDGSGNGWEPAPNPSANELVEWFLGSGAANPADFNNDGTVDAADYVLWRKQGLPQSQYDLWRASFGVSGGGGGAGESTLADGGAINLGTAFNVGGAQDLVFEFVTAASVLTGAVEYGAFGSGSALGQAVPEPSAAWLLVGAALLACRRRRTTRGAVLVRVTACLVVSTLASTTAVAAVTLDRLYCFGENACLGHGNLPQTQENGVVGMPVGSGVGNPLPGATLDHTGPSGSFQGLLALPSGSGPLYADVSDRPGAGSGAIGVAFDGVDDFLSGFALGFPPITRSTARHIQVYGSGSGTLNYDGVYQRGVQFWVYPHFGASATQHVVSDTTQHGVRITAAGNWALVHAGAEVNSNVPVSFNQWAHVMAAMPDNSAPHKAVLYVNGVAVTAHQANYSTSSTVNAQGLIVGANSHADGGLVGTSNFFSGRMDELEMFVWGRRYDPGTDAFFDFGTFNFFTDNRYAAANLSPVFGDITNSGSITQADVNAFVAGWLHEKRVNNIRVGDITTYAMGDLNFDGITDLRDARLFRQALLGSGAGAGLDLTAFNALISSAVPEPSTLSLAGLVLLSFAMRRRRTPAA